MMRKTLLIATATAALLASIGAASAQGHSQGNLPPGANAEYQNGKGGPNAGPWGGYAYGNRYYRGSRVERYDNGY